MANSVQALRRFRIVLWSLVAVVAIGATALFVLRPPAAPNSPARDLSAQAFRLQSTTGGAFSNTDLKGKPTLVFFGYTFCPDVCPTTMAEIVQWKADLKLMPGQLRTLFVTVDPDRDSVATLADYLGAFDPTVIGLRGDADQTDAIKRAFGAFSEKTGDDGSGRYLVNHTAGVFLVGSDGTYQGMIAYQENAATAEAKIQRLMAG